MTDRDLTPDEARAEVEAFMGDGWVCGAYGGSIQWVEAEFRPDDNVSGPNLSCGRATYREAVDALKQAWRDAVRPWVAAPIVDVWRDGCEYGYEEASRVAGMSHDERVPSERYVAERVARVLKEDSNG